MLPIMPVEKFVQFWWKVVSNVDVFCGIVKFSIENKIKY